MKHISEFIAIKKERLGLDRIRRQLSLFAATQEKGSREWSLFDPVRHDRADSYPVSTPRKVNTPRYPNVVPIHRYPRHLTPKFSH